LTNQLLLEKIAYPTALALQKGFLCHGMVSKTAIKNTAVFGANYPKTTSTMFEPKTAGIEQELVRCCYRY
jgi:hypothetical protein